MFSREKLFLGVKPEKNRFKVALPFKGRGWITEITQKIGLSVQSLMNWRNYTDSSFNKFRDTSNHKAEPKQREVHYCL